MSDSHSFKSLLDLVDTNLSNCRIQDDEANSQEPLPRPITTPYLPGPQQDDSFFGTQQHISDNIFNEQEELKKKKQQEEIERLDYRMRRKIKREEKNASMPSIRESGEPGIPWALPENKGFNAFQNPEDTETTQGKPVSPQGELSGFGKVSTGRMRRTSPYSTNPDDSGTLQYDFKNRSPDLQRPSRPSRPFFVHQYRAYCEAG